MQNPLEIEPDAWCAFCGTPLPEKEDRDPRQKYCSKWCCNQAHKLRTYNPPPMRRGECAECGAEFWTYWSYHRFCSQRCYQRDYRRRFPRPSRAVVQESRPCAECGQDFTPRRRDAKFCSVSCRNRANGRRRRAKG